MSAQDDFFLCSPHFVCSGRVAYSLSTWLYKYKTQGNGKNFQLRARLILVFSFDKKLMRALH